jgi:hypothetical protein
MLRGIYWLDTWLLGAAAVLLLRGVGSSFQLRQLVFKQVMYPRRHDVSQMHPSAWNEKSTWSYEMAHTFHRVDILWLPRFSWTVVHDRGMGASLSSEEHLVHGQRIIGTTLVGNSWSSFCELRRRFLRPLGCELLKISGAVRSSSALSTGFAGT